MRHLDKSCSSLRRITFAAAATFALTVEVMAHQARPAHSQAVVGGATPLAVDLKKVPICSYAEYKIAFGDQAADARWALVGRKSDSVTIEMTMQGGPATQMGGGKMTARMVMAPDPTKADRAIKQMVVQKEGQDPMEMPTQGMNQKFERPDPKKLVGKESITVPAGDFAVSHYRDTNERGNLEMWVSETVPPLGLVKLSFTPKAGSPMPKVGMELAGKGKDAKPIITKTPKPFDPQAMMQGMRRPDGAGPGAGPGKPGALGGGAATPSPPIGTTAAPPPPTSPGGTAPTPKP